MVTLGDGTEALHDLYRLKYLNQVKVLLGLAAELCSCWARDVMCFSTRGKAARFHLIVISEIRVALMWAGRDKVSSNLV